MKSVPARRDFFAASKYANFDIFTRAYAECVPTSRADRSRFAVGLPVPRRMPDASQTELSEAFGLCCRARIVGLDFSKKSRNFFPRSLTFTRKETPLDTHYSYSLLFIPRPQLINRLKGVSDFSSNKSYLIIM